MWRMTGGLQQGRRTNQSFLKPQVFSVGAFLGVVWVRNSPDHSIEREVQAPGADVALQGIHPALQHGQQVCFQVPRQLLRRAFEQLCAQPADQVGGLRNAQPK